MSLPWWFELVCFLATIPALAVCLGFLFGSLAAVASVSDEDRRLAVPMFMGSMAAGVVFGLCVWVTT